MGYELWRDDGALGSFEEVDNTLGPSTFSYSVDSLLKSASYRFKVIVYNEIGRTDSNVVSSIVADVPDTPTEAPDFNIAETTIESIRIILAEVAESGGSQILSYNL